MLRELLNIRKGPAVKLDRILKSSIVLALVVSLCVLLLVPSVVFAQDNLTEESINPDSLGVSSDSSQVAAFVTRFYQLCLSRDPDSAGLNGWVNWLVTGAKTGADVAYGFVFSDEFIARNVSNEQYLTILYRAFFNREPDSGGYNSWLGYLNTGKSRQWVLAGFVNSQEFKNLCAAYGINPGSLEVDDNDSQVIEEGWMQNPSNGHYYRLTEPLSWLEAETQAVKWGGHLVTINNRDEELWLKNQFGVNEYFWIGFNDISTEGYWEWVSGEPVTYTNWWEREPNNNSRDGGIEENAAIMNWAGSVQINGEWISYYGDGWNDVPINETTRGIVEKTYIK